MIAYTPIIQEVGIEPDLANIKNYFQENCFTSQRWNQFGVRQCTSSNIHPRDQYRLKSRFDLTWEWLPSFVEGFPKITELVESLPFEKLTWCALMSNHEDVPHHCDYNFTPNQNFSEDRFIHDDKITTWLSNLESLEPSSLRISLYGDPSGSFFVSKVKVEDIGGRFQYFGESFKDFINLPASTRVFAFNSTEITHGADLRSEKILLLLNGLLNIDRYRILLEKSVQKYQEFLVEY